MISTIVTDAPDSQISYGLAVETSCHLGSVAIGRAGVLMAERSFSGPRKHATEFVAAIDSLCRAQGVSPEQIGEVYVSHGPGSFAGLRIGVTAARMIAFAHGAVMVPTPTLDVIAHNALAASPTPEHVAVMLDAKRHRVFAASFDLSEATYVARAHAAELDPRVFLSQQQPGCLILGEGAPIYHELVARSSLAIGESQWHVPKARVVYELGYALARRGKTVPPREFVPLYIRPPEAEEQWNARHGS